jgi:hypothetical protein
MLDLPQACPKEVASHAVRDSLNHSRAVLMIVGEEEPPC